MGKKMNYLAVCLSLYECSWPWVDFETIFTV